MRRPHVYHFRRHGARSAAACDWRVHRRVLPIEYSLSPVFVAGRRLVPCEHCLSATWEREHRRQAAPSWDAKSDPVWDAEMLRQWSEANAAWEAMFA